MLSKYFLRLRGRGVVVSLVRFYWFFFSTLLHELSNDGRKQFKWSSYRAFVLLATFVMVPLLMVWNHAGLLIDDFIFPAWAFESVEKPLFIVGNARSGTTWFHRLLVETDSPYLAPMPHRGKTNEPAYTVHVLRELAAVHNMSVEDMAIQTKRNTYNLFTTMERPK